MQNGSANNQYNVVPIQTPDYSTFDMSHEVKMSMKMGTISPCLTQEVLPGDKWNISSEAMFRMLAMITPVMHKVQIYFHFFFVPNRILWPNWKEYITGGETFTGSGTPPAHPVLAAWAAEVGDLDPSSLANYLGLPVLRMAQEGRQLTAPVNALPFAAYQRIWHEYYRDENLQLPNTDPYECIDGDQAAADYPYLTKLQNRAWEHDRFTSMLPWAQKGAPVEIPISLTADVVLKGIANPLIRDVSGALMPNNMFLGVDAVNPGLAKTFDRSTAAPYTQAYDWRFDPNGSLGIAGGQTSTTVNDLRDAITAQKWQELNARGGGRYIEVLRNHFGVTSSDARLQRPEFIGGSRAVMNISEVLQTSSTGVTGTPQGNMAGHGISITDGGRISYRAEEHGFIMGLISILPTTTYYQGIPKFFSKTDKFSYAFPSLAHLGETEVKGQELAFTDGAYDQSTLGYLPQYYEYRDQPNRVAGEMATTLEAWHMGRKFDLNSPPALNQTFIVSDPTRRIFADTTDNDKIICHIFHNVNTTRALPRYGEPGSL